MRVLAFLLFFLTFGAYAAETRRTFAECQYLMRDNTARLITPEVARDCVLASGFSRPVSFDSGTSRTLTAADRAKHIVFTSASAVAVTLPAAGSTGFEDGWWAYLAASGAGAVTITSASNINNSTTYVIPPGGWLFLFSSGTKYSAASLGMTLVVGEVSGTTRSLIRRTSNATQFVNNAGVDAFTIYDTGRLNLLGPTAPASSSATCALGDIGWDTGYVYVCVATNTWKRFPLESF